MSQGVTSLNFISYTGAFYPDNYVVLFDALVREKYIRQEELGPRLKLPNEEVRKMVVQVCNQRAICTMHFSPCDGVAGEGEDAQL